MSHRPFAELLRRDGIARASRPGGLAERTARTDVIFALPRCAVCEEFLSALRWQLVICLAAQAKAITRMTRS